MKYFVAVAEEGQMTRAARRLDLAQPVLSHAIAQLESQLGTRLLERHARGVRLTQAGNAFLPKARNAISRCDEADATARSFARASHGVIAFGFLGVPPGLDSPGPFEDFARAHPNIALRFRELPFPTTPTASWLTGVDVAVCHAPQADANVWRDELRREPRVVLAPERHALAQRSKLAVAEVLDATFIGLHPSVEPSWAGFWSLDDHRGGPPARVTADDAANPQEVLASLAVRNAITTVPASVGAALSKIPAGVVAIPLHDAHPCTITVIGHDAPHNPHVAALRAFARNISSFALQAPLSV